MGKASLRAREIRQHTPHGEISSLQPMPVKVVVPLTCLAPALRS